MKKILIFSGTTEGRRLSELLASADIAHTVSVATNYGELVMHENPLVSIHTGRLSEDTMLSFIRENEFQVVVDATHPYANIVTKTIRRCVECLKIEQEDIIYLRIERNIEDSKEYIQSDMNHDSELEILFFSNHIDCIKRLRNVPGNILLTTGSKELSIYCQEQEIRRRIYARVLPGLESLNICKEQGLLPEQIIALQGPFSTALNEAIIQQYHINCMVTKQGGTIGGFPEKIQAAKNANIPIFVIKSENENCEEMHNHHSFYEACKILEIVTEKRILKTEQATAQISLAGIGMGSKETMTIAVKRIIDQADLIIGSERVIAPFYPRLEKKEAYMPNDIRNWIYNKTFEYADREDLKIVVVFSGDSGFFSGCQNIKESLSEAMALGELRGNITIYPGISSIQSMAAACGISWQNAGIYSIHGRTNQEGWIENLFWQIQKNQMLFLLVSGAEDIQQLGHILNDTYEVYVGYQLSYPEEEVICLTPEQCKNVKKEGLYIVVIRQKSARRDENINLTPYLKDEDFVRGTVPMTKEEVRQLSICKLHIKQESVLYDIGSGTGSIAIEAANLSNHIKVYAIERNEAAIDLLNKNKNKYKCNNLEVIQGEAPDALKNLRIPTHAFIGGSGDKLFSILQELYHLNPRIRVVMNAISLETLSRIQDIPNHFQVQNMELIQVQINRYFKAGAYHMPKTEHPVFICSFEFAMGEHHKT